MFVVEHALQPLTRHVALAASVDRVADRHVVCGHRFGDGAGRAAHFEEPAGNFLSGADLGECAVPQWIEVDLERLLICAQPGAFICNRSVESVCHVRHAAGSLELGESVSYRQFGSCLSLDKNCEGYLGLLHGGCSPTLLKRQLVFTFDWAFRFIVRLCGQFLRAAEPADT